MTENVPEVYRHQNFEDDGLIIAPNPAFDGGEEVEIVLAEEKVEKPSTERWIEKPSFSGTTKTVLGPDKGNPRTVTSGPEVAYVNSLLGVDGDEFTEATLAAVAERQKAEGLRPTGRMTRSQYEKL